MGLLPAQTLSSGADFCFPFPHGMMTCPANHTCPLKKNKTKKEPHNSFHKLFLKEHNKNTNKDKKKKTHQQQGKK